MNIVMQKDDFLWIQNWYQIHCNGDWEHSNGIHLGTIDNPGWSFTVNLQDTELEDKKFKEVEINYSDNDWICCFIKNKKFEGRCCVANLPKVLQIFRNWAENKDIS